MSRTPPRDPSVRPMPPVLLRFAICLAVVCAADAWFVTRALEANGGTFCPTTDDAFIHLQYARSFAELRPLVYQPGDPPTTGATSLLFPMAVAVGFWLGLGGMQLVWVSNAVSALALSATMTAAWGFAHRAVGPRAGPGAALSIVACPTFALLAFGGMEVGLSTGLHFAATAGAVLWWLDPDARRGSAGTRRAAGLVVLGGLASVGRPEGLVSALIVTVTLLLRPPGARPRTMRALALLAPLPWLIPSIVAFATTGTPSTSGTLIKLMPADPFRHWDETRRVLDWNATNVFELLFLGKEVPGIVVYPALPKATYALWALGLVGLGWAFARRAGKAGFVAVLAWALASSVVLGTLLYTWIGNMGRYVLAFAPMIVLTASLGITALASELLGRFGRMSRARPVAEALLPLGIAAVFVVAPDAAVRQHAEATREICAQQVAMAERVRALPPEAVVAVNDAGAIAFLGERRTWDLIGLTSPGAALPRLSGMGSVFERIERLPRRLRPTHAAIYPGWFPGIAALGRPIDRKTVFGPYVGAPEKILYELDTALYGSGETPPLTSPSRRVVDELDVADVDSERAHGYGGLAPSPLPRADLHRLRREERFILDGGRPLASGDRATLAAEPGRPAALSSRFVAPHGARVEVRWNGAAHRVDLPPGPGFREWTLELPAGAVAARNRLEREVLRGSVSVTHDWLSQ